MTNHGKAPWWILARSEEVTGKKPLSVDIGDQPIVMWRDNQGVVRALEDRCPHRRAPLSLGCIRDNGWIQCTYCAIGAIPDGGDKASTDPLAVCEGAGGNFAGVFEANYDTSTLSFTDGVWNGAEDLCTGIGGTPYASCNDGGSPGPEGGPPTNYLRLDAGYGLAPNYGGSGNWTASCLDCEHD